MAISTNRLLIKLLAIVIVITTTGSGLLIFQVMKIEQKNLFAEKVRASELMAKPMLHSLYQGMLEERADMVRYFITGVIETVEGIKRVQIVRNNGLEAAFQDFKTLKDVEQVYGDLKPEWTNNHPDKPVNVADGVNDPNFKEALKLFQERRKESIYYVEKAGDERLLTYLRPVVKFNKCNACHIHDETIRGVLMISTSLEDMYKNLAASRKRWVLLVSSTLLATCLALAFMTRVVITRPIGQTTNILKKIADGKGDLTKRLRISSNDEVGVMCKVFNQFIDGLQGMIKDILTSSTKLASLSDEITHASQGFQQAADNQMTAVEAASSSIIEMDQSLGEVRGNTEQLLTSVRGAFDASHEMSASGTEIANNTAELATSVEQTVTDINQIVSFQKQSASHIGTLYEEIEQVASVANEINAAIKAVDHLAKEQAARAEQVVQTVSSHLEAVKSSTKAIDKMTDDTTKTSLILNELGERSKKISGIIDVINGVAETTQLLSLNASILAAQAGEHGRGFAIVASEVKTLSDQTTNSTKEIAKLVEQVQRDIESTAASVEGSMATVVGETAKLSRGTTEALKNVEKSSRATLEVSRKVELASQEQTKAVGLVTDSINKINGMIADIKRAIDSQSGASENILQVTDHMQKITLDVKRSTIDQSSQGQQIYSVLKDVSERMQEITNSIGEHKATSERAVRAVEVIRSSAEDNVSRTRDLDQTVDRLLKQAALLNEKVESFRV